jgi:outer membrane lipopolysaccharide assembly protein LptE/RlpB
MLKDKFKIEENGMTIEANWDKTSKISEDFRFTLGKKSVVINRDFIYKLLMVFGKSQEQEDLMELKSKSVVNINRQITIKAKKAIKKGDMMTFNISYPVSEYVYNKINNKKPPNLKGR